MTSQNTIPNLPTFVRPLWKHNNAVVLIRAHAQTGAQYIAK